MLHSEAPYQPCGDLPLLHRPSPRLIRTLLASAPRQLTIVGIRGRATSRGGGHRPTWSRSANLCRKPRHPHERGAARTMSSELEYELVQATPPRAPSCLWCHAAPCAPVRLKHACGSLRPHPPEYDASRCSASASAASACGSSTYVRTSRTSRT